MRTLLTDSEVCGPEELQIDVSSALCFTGHRTSRIGSYRDDERFRELTMKTAMLMLARAVDLALQQGYRTFISGLAEGTDLWCSDYVLKKKMRDPEIKLIGVMPYLRHGERLNSKWRELLARTELGADMLISTNPDPRIVFSSSGSSVQRGLYRERNYFMVDNSSAVIAFINEDLSHSGTHQTVAYAERLGRKIHRISVSDVYGVLDDSDTDDRSRIITEVLRHITEF